MDSLRGTQPRQPPPTTALPKQALDAERAPAPQGTAWLATLSEVNRWDGSDVACAVFVESSLDHGSSDTETFSFFRERRQHER